MRHRWVSDIADFAKYGILRRLVGDDLRLGIVWYLTAGDGNENPLTKYLHEPAPNKVAACDEELCSRLKQIMGIATDKRRVNDVLKSGVFAARTASFVDELKWSESAARLTREKQRRRWLGRALIVTAECDVVFFDPDTGIAGTRIRPNQKKATKYTFLHEISEFVAREQTVVTVQFGKPGGLEKGPLLATQRLGELTEALGNTCAPPIGLWWSRGHNVGMLIAPAKKHSNLVRRRALALLNDPRWKPFLTELET